MRSNEAFPAKFKKAADVKAKPLFAIISHVEMELVGQGQDQNRNRFSTLRTTKSRWC
jgi:hypothetical protein